MSYLQHLPSQDVVDLSTTQYCYGHDQKRKKKDLMHFRIPDIQKLKVCIRTSPLLVVHLYMCMSVCVDISCSASDQCHIYIHGAEGPWALPC